MASTFDARPVLDRTLTGTSDAAVTDSGVALRGYELGLRQVKDQFLRAPLPAPR